MIVLSIETSCDDTGVALLDIRGGKMKIVADFVSSQNAIHAPYGGVVPNLAVRAHYKNLPILLEQVLAKIDSKKIDLIAVTIGPGLEPCLWAGVNTAKVLAMAMRRPIKGVNHLEGHIAANFIGGISNFQFLISKQFSKTKNQKLKTIFPAVCLIVSGGHTQLVLIEAIGKYKVIGQTRDDAAGEAFDKVAKMLGLGYPGGPQIALKAKKGCSDAFKLPRPMSDSPNYDFSFSGLKTAVLYLLCDSDFGFARQQLFTDRRFATPPTHQVSKQLLPRIQKDKKFQVFRPEGARSRFGRTGSKLQDLCASFQQAVVDVLISKTIKAVVEHKARTVMLSGGVAANDLLRKKLKLETYNLKLNFLAPAKKFCTDNAVMIGLAGYWKYQRQGADKIEKIIAKANLNF